MEVPTLVPNSVPLVLGTEELAEQARRTRTNVSVVLPPIDVDADHPGIDGGDFRRGLGVDDDEILVVTVSRLSIRKLDALVDAIDAVGLLAAHRRVRLIVVGDGEARSQLEARAAKLNERLGRQVVVLAGSTMDPRPAYAAADVVLGMGGSALRALAIGKPVVVQGKGGFSRPFGPESLDTFLWQGFWGVGTGERGGEQLAEHLQPLVTDREFRKGLGEYGRGIVVERFSISQAASAIEDLYTTTIREYNTRSWRAREAAVVASRALRIEYEAHLPSNKRARAAEEAARLGSASEQGAVN
jgi:glycosyltransferase involved in cell wall biosynthesis